MTAILARLRTLPISRAVILAGVIVGAVVGVFAVGAVGVLAQGNKPARTPSAIITMEKGGEIVLDFYVKDAPRHVENFVTLAKKGFYDGQRVHRVEPNFVVQFGDPQSKTKPMDDPAMGSGGPGYTIKAEFNGRKFERGVLGMARTNDPDSAGSQVYIMLAPAPFLNGKYTAFGQVSKGMEIVDTIRVGDRIKSIKVVDK